MPTTYTHYAFGQDVIHLLPGEIQDVLRPYEDYYNIGVHGPDILFYYRSYSKNKVNQYGVRVHKEPMERFLTHAFSIFPKQNHQRASFAYLAGFMTHFILDSACHPYIRKRIRETGICHAEIERDWDSVMMQRDHLNPISHLVARHIRTRPGYGHVIAPYYNMTPLQIRTSLFYMRMILNHLFRSSFGITSHLASFTNKVFLKKLNYQHYFVKKDVNPKNIDTILHLDQLYDNSKEECAQLITEMYSALQSRDLGFCKKERFQRHFS